MKFYIVLLEINFLKCANEMNFYLTELAALCYNQSHTSNETAIVMERNSSNNVSGGERGTIELPSSI